MQKLALARVFAHEYDIVVLDEPSSALDPISENELFMSITEAARNKTVFFITHRLSTVSLADRIIFVENGKIGEIGTFTELMGLNGKFAKMYNAQASKYIV